jgi:NAD(P)-dependent dehydrogenase (short-subunit alcohol dehydrogenase family)
MGMRPPRRRMRLLPHRCLLIRPAGARRLGWAGQDGCGGGEVIVAHDHRIGVVTGANQGLGLAVVAGLAPASGDHSTVYLTGRDQQRVEAAAASVAQGGINVVPEVCDVRDDDAAHGLARRIGERHGGVDFIDSNAAAGISPACPPLSPAAPDVSRPPRTRCPADARASSN